MFSRKDFTQNRYCSGENFEGIGKYPDTTVACDAFVASSNSDIIEK